MKKPAKKMPFDVMGKKMPNPMPPKMAPKPTKMAKRGKK